MSSERKIAANRRNAQRSTGPRTALGKAHVSRNAIKHGLASKGSVTEEERKQIDALASTLIGGNDTDERRIHARSAAAAHMLLQLAERAKNDCIEKHIGARRRTSAHAKRRGHGSKGRAVAGAYLDAAPELIRLDRYVSCALGQRNKALRALQHSHGLRSSDKANW